MADHTAEADEDISSTLVSTLKSNQLAHLHDILRDELHPLDYYYGKNAGGFSNTESYANNIAQRHSAPAEKFLYRDASDFNYSQRNRRALDDLLIKQGVDAEALEEYDPTYTDYLLIIYHHFYEPAREAVLNYQYIAAKTLLFQEHSGKVFHHYKQLYIDEDHLKRKCRDAITTISDNGRNFHIEPLLVDDGSEAVLKFYWERTRNPEMIFKSRLPEDQSNSGDTGVTHRPAYPVKTITLKIENEEEQGKIRLSRSKNGWESKLEKFFDVVYGISDPFNTFEPKRDAAVDQVIDAVQEAAKPSEEDDEVDEDTIFETAQDQIQELGEDTVEDLREEDEEVADTLESRYKSIHPTGIVIRDDDETLSEEFSIKSKATLKEWEDKNKGASTIITHELNNAEKDKIGIRFRGELRGEDTPDEFVLMDGTWYSEDGGGVPQETTELLNQLLGDTDGQ